MYIIVTNVDSSTQLACTTEPMKSGPGFPVVNNLVIDWQDESNWPIATVNGVYQNTPLYYGTCDDSVDSVSGLPGVIEIIDEATFISRKRDEYYARRPFLSWVFDETHFTWSAPVPMPMDGKMYTWDEAANSWVEQVML